MDDQDYTATAISPTPIDSSKESRCPSSTPKLSHHYPCTFYNNFPSRQNCWHHSSGPMSTTRFPRHSSPAGGRRMRPLSTRSHLQYLERTCNSERYTPCLAGLVCKQGSGTRSSRPQGLEGYSGPLRFRPTLPRAGRHRSRRRHQHTRSNTRS